MKMLICYFLFLPCMLSAQEPYLVKDFLPETNPEGSLEHAVALKFAVIDEYAYFAAADPVRGGVNWWRTDGTPEGTNLFTVLYPGLSSGITNYSAWHNDALLFFVTCGRTELWRMDGTPDGTRKIKIVSEHTSSWSPSNFILLNDKLYFVVKKNYALEELWVTDGTGEGTNMIMEFPLLSNILTFGKTGLVLAGNQFFFTLSGSEYGNELWVSNGSKEGTFMAKDINPGKGHSYPDELVNIGGTLYFNANDGIHGVELWKSDGTPEGTLMVKDINSGKENSLPSEMTSFNNKIYFRAHAPSTGSELWMTDGTEQGTQLVKDIQPGELNSSPWYITSWNDFLFFSADDGPHGHALWKSDGTAEGTQLVRDIWPGKRNSVISRLIASQDQLFFSADDSIHGCELWVSDGSFSGTRMVKDINPGSDPAFSSLANAEASFAVHNSKLFFNPEQPDAGKEPWISDGTETGTFMLKDITANVQGSDPHHLTDINGTLYLTAVDSLDEEEHKYRGFYKTNGNDQSTGRLMQLLPYGSDILSLTPLGKDILYSANFPGYGIELGITDGSPEGTKLLKDCEPGSLGGQPTALTPYNNKYYFGTGIYPGGFWKSDGTEEGTGIVVDTFAIGGIFPAHGLLYLMASDIWPRHYALWKTDGTEKGTQLVKDINPYAQEGTSIGSFTLLKDEILFVASDTGANMKTNYELWLTDGTTHGTQKVKEIYPGTNGSDPKFLVTVNNHTFFIANDGIHGEELWKTDGTAEGTVLLKDINPGKESSVPGKLLNFNGMILFTAYSPSAGNELWISDGTTAGTLLLKDIAQGNPDGACFRGTLTTAGDYAYFAGSDETGNFELWQTDGTEEGTKLAAEIVAGSEGSYPQEITVVGDKLYFTAFHPNYGRELWALDISTGLHNPKVEKVLRVYPNPAIRSLEIDGIHNNTISVIDITGRIIKSVNTISTHQILDISGLQPGIYFIRDGECSEKFIKN